jgi:hypothetical protein
LSETRATTPPQKIIAFFFLSGRPVFIIFCQQQLVSFLPVTPNPVRSATEDLSPRIEDRRGRNRL